jgi:SAM-dependent methyltransferase
MMARLPCVARADRTDSRRAVDATLRRAQLPEISQYYDLAMVAREVAAGRHREAVGGQWDQLGKLQIDFLRTHGLTPTCTLVDIGCGCLRAGVHIVDFLDPGHYFGIDISNDLLRAGYDIEIRSLGLDSKLPCENIVCDGDFKFDKFPAVFDFAIAQSLFTHLPVSHVQVCLSRLALKMHVTGVLFGTFFLVPADHPHGLPFQHPHGVRSFDDFEPYHYRYGEVQQLCKGLPWDPELIGCWGHPLDQQMVRFRTRAD